MGSLKAFGLIFTNAVQACAKFCTRLSILITISLVITIFPSQLLRIEIDSE